MVGYTLTRSSLQRTSQRRTIGSLPNPKQYSLTIKKLRYHEKPFQRVVLSTKQQHKVLWIPYMTLRPSKDSPRITAFNPLWKTLKNSSVNSGRSDVFFQTAHGFEFGPPKPCQWRNPQLQSAPLQQSLPEMWETLAGWGLNQGSKNACVLSLIYGSVLLILLDLIHNKHND